MQPLSSGNISKVAVLSVVLTDYCVHFDSHNFLNFYYFQL